MKCCANTVQCNNSGNRHVCSSQILRMKSKKKMLKSSERLFWQSAQKGRRRCELWCVWYRLYSYWHNEIIVRERHKIYTTPKCTNHRWHGGGSCDLESNVNQFMHIRWNSTGESIHTIHTNTHTQTHTLVFAMFNQASTAIDAEDEKIYSDSLHSPYILDIYISICTVCRRYSHSRPVRCLHTWVRSIVFVQKARPRKIQ